MESPSAVGSCCDRQKDAPEDDVFLDHDAVGKGGAQTKRNAVKLDGYDSDSSEGNFDARADDEVGGL